MTLKEMILSMNLLQICYAFFVINVGMFKTGLLKVESVFAAVLYLIPPCAVLGTVVWNMFVRVF